MKLSVIEEIKVAGGNYLFHAEDNSLIELDELAGAVVNYFKQAPGPTRAGCLEELGRAHHAPELSEVLGELEVAGILRSTTTALGPVGRAEQPPGTFPLKNLILLVAQDCNM